MTSAEVAARADAPPPPPPTFTESLQLRWRQVQSSALLPVVLTAVAALILGLYAGRATAPTVDPDLVAVLQRDVLPLVVDADAIWTAGSADLPPVGPQLVELRAGGDPGVVADHLDGWLDAYDRTLRRIVGAEVPAQVRPVQRQFAAAVTLSRDAVELAGAAAATDDPTLRRELSSEAVRVRIRAEQASQAAQASLADLRGGAGTGVSVPPAVPSFADLR